MKYRQYFTNYDRRKQDVRLLNRTSKQQEPSNSQTQQQSPWNGTGWREIRANSNEHNKHVHPIESSHTIQVNERGESKQRLKQGIEGIEKFSPIYTSLN